ncbi:hypothetical protein GCM10011351_01380 [Paraliobacillus quinghaiensis]|uniref:Diguanylate cyclase n=1 Tax=Paraliobacillus quinghaiensis TaxID=470815 RepID=A0A917TD61_9BACI|nr:hypothetical protein GCM10011351_01380 [Paraliobacillus quinghaiensis]
MKISPIYNKQNKLHYYTGIQTDITAKKNQTLLIENQLAFVRNMLVTGNPTVNFVEFPKLIEGHLGMACTVLRYDYKQETYQLFTSNSVPDLFKESINCHSFGKLDSNPYDVFTKETLLIDDIYNDNRFKPFWKIAKACGYKALWSTPMHSNDGEILGIFTVYTANKKNMNQVNLHALDSYSSILGMALQNVQYNDKLEKSERRYRLIEGNSTDLVCLLDEKLQVEYISPAYTQIVGEEFSLSGIKQVFSEESFSKVIAFIDLLKLNKQHDTIEIKIKDTDDSWHWLEVKGSQLHDEEEQQIKILLVARDITERKDFEDTLNRLIHYDALTNLPNQYYFKQTLSQIIEQDQPFALLLLDFDQMKVIRSLYGEETADFVLSQLPDKVNNTLPTKMIARTGESQFSILIEQNQDSETIGIQVNKLLQVLEQPWHYNNQEFVATVSMGVALFKEQTADTLRIQADLALQTAQKTGKHRYHIYIDEMHKGIRASIAIQNDLYHALDRNQFKMMYQPQVNLEEMSVDGVEALIRWEHPTLGMVSPDEFIKIAEGTGWIVPISEWIIRQVCLDTLKWHKQGIKRTASINISYRQMESDGFIDNVKAILEETACPAELLTFEITESMLMRDLSLSMQILLELKALGIRISVDDFGVGYSSLSYLKKFPIDCLKIDRAFVTNIHEDSNDFAIVQAIMEMTRVLGLTVIAEGTESKEHVRILHKLGCYHFQGFWFSKPVDYTNLQSSIDKIYQEKLHVFSK